MFIADLLSEFERFVLSRYSSPQTRRAYLGDIKLFLEGEYPFSEEGVERFMVDLIERGISRRTIRRKLSSLSVFFNFLKQRGKIDFNPIDLVDKPKQEKRLPNFLNVDEVAVLLDGIENKRDRAMLELLYSSSLRASELVGLNVEDVDLKNLRVRVRRKGGFLGYVPFGKRAARYIEEYLGKRKQGPLFLNRYGERLSTRSLQKIVKKYAMNRLFKDISPHALRHSKATHLLNSGMDIRLLQKFLGHSSIRATQIYTHLNLNELASTYDSTHPLALEDE